MESNPILSGEKRNREWRGGLIGFLASGSGGGGRRLVGAMGATGAGIKKKDGRYMDQKILLGIKNRHKKKRLELPLNSLIDK